MELPEQFEATIGGYMGSAFWIKLVDGILEYRQAEVGYEYADPEYLELSARKWVNFRQKLDAIGVWDWKTTDESKMRPAYENPGVMDGTGWSLQIDWGDRRLRSSGDNNGPGFPFAPSDISLELVTMAGPRIEVSGFDFPDAPGPIAEDAFGDLDDDPDRCIGIEYSISGWADGHDLLGFGAPSSRAWYALSRCIDEIGAWTWGANYSVDPYVTDLPQWSLLYTRGSEHLESWGYGAYPDGWERLCSAVVALARDAARPGRRRLTAFGEYLHAVRLLIGGRAFS